MPGAEVTVLPAETARRALEHLGIFTGRAGERLLEATAEFLRTREYGGTVRQQPQDGSIAFIGDAAPAAEVLLEVAQMARQGQYGGAAATSAPRRGQAARSPRLRGIGVDLDPRVKMALGFALAIAATGGLAALVAAFTPRPRSDEDDDR